MNKNEVTPVQIAIRIVIIIIVITILLMVSFAMVRFVPKVLSSLTNFRSIFGSKERLAVDLDPETISQNGRTVLTLKQSGGKDGGAYELSFSCSKIASDTFLKIVRDGEQDVIGCEDAFALPASPSATTTGAITLEHAGEAVSYDQPMLITVKHVTATSTLSSGSATLKVLGAKAGAPVAATSTPSVTTTTKTETQPPLILKPVTNNSSSYSSAPAQLVASLSSVNVDQNGRATVTFYVTNTGGQNSGAWAFTATLPRLGQTAYNSGYQPSIPPRGTSVMYLAFDDAQAGDVHIYVQNSHISAQLR